MNFQSQQTGFNGTVRVRCDLYSNKGDNIYKAASKYEHRLHEKDYDIFVTKDRFKGTPNQVEIFIQNSEEYLDGKTPKKVFYSKDDDMVSISKTALKALKEHDTVLNQNNSNTSKNGNVIKNVLNYFRGLF